MQESGAHLPQAFPQPSGQVTRGHPQRGLGAGLDDLEHGLGLREIQTSGQKGPQSELPRPGQARPLGQDLPENGLEHRKPRVAVNFHHILPGVGMGSPHEGEQNFVEHVTLGIKDVPQVKAVGLPNSAGAARAKNAARDGLGFGAAKPHDADARLSRRRGDGRNGVPRRGPDHGESALSSWKSFFRTG